MRRAALRLLLIFCLSLSLAGFAAIAAAGENKQSLPVLSKPFAAPEFSLRGEDGKDYTLSAYRGKVVVLTFWATWCPPCRFEMPSLGRAWLALKDEGFMFFGVNVGEDADTIFEFTGDYPVTFPLPMDRDGKVIKSYSVIGLPTSYIIDANGQVTHRAIGSREWDSPEILQALRAVRDGKLQ